MPRSSKCLLAILLFSLLINTWGITWGLPQRWHPDELTQRAENMVGTPTLNPHYFAYGGFHYYVIAAFAVLPVKTPNRLLNLVDYETQSTIVVMLSRLLSALFGTGVVWLAYAIGHNLFGRRTGLFAAALTASSMIFVNLSHFATADVPSLFWFTLACLMATHVFQAGTRRWYFLAGLCAGLAAAVKYVGGLSLIALLAAHFLRQSQRHRLLVGASLVAVAAFVLGNPAVLFAPCEFAEGFVAESVFNSLRGVGLPRALLPLLFQLKDALGLPAFLLSAAGVAYAVRLLASKERASVLLVLAMLLPYYVVSGSMRGPRAGPLLLPLPPLRYTLPMVPFVLLLAAKMLDDLLAVDCRVVRGLSAGLCGIVLCYSGAYAACVDLALTHDSRYAARDWLLKNVAAGSTIETTSYGPNLPADMYKVVERPHDNDVANVAALVNQSESYRRLQATIARLYVWLDRVGLRPAGADYVPWYRRALRRYSEDAATFDTSIKGLELRSPDVLLVSDLYAGRFSDSSPEGVFFKDIFSGKSRYERVAQFHYEGFRWLDPPAEFVNPTIGAYVRKQTPVS